MSNEDTVTPRSARLQLRSVSAMANPYVGAFGASQLRRAIPPASRPNLPGRTRRRAPR